MWTRKNGNYSETIAISYTVICISSNHSQNRIPEGDFFPREKELKANPQAQGWVCVCATPRPRSRPIPTQCG